MRETRAGRIGGLRYDEEEGRHYFTARIVNYGVPDSYKTSWAPGVFVRSLEKKLPTVVFAHQWDRPIGKVVSYHDNDDGLDVDVRMSDLEVNPDAKRMWHHLKDGEIEEFSFAFERRNEEPDVNHRGVTRILEADMDEVSPVLKGSVPGTKLLSIRSGESIPAEAAADILVKFSQGSYDLADALAALKSPVAAEVLSNNGTTESVEVNTSTATSEMDTKVSTEPDPMESDILAKLDSMARAKKNPKAPYGDVKYADPGYQDDGVKRYPIDTEDHVRAAWSYINQSKNAAKYSPDELSKIKSRIKAAAKKFGIEIGED